MHRWWSTRQSADPNKIIMGKPSVLFRKVVNTHDREGNPVAVNAQQYAVLVMDVPDLRAEQKK